MAEFAKSVKSEFRENPYDPHGPYDRPVTQPVGDSGTTSVHKFEL
jgi:hypothetical protein